MRVLIVKTSSLGDVIHTLPALTDAGRHIPGIRFDWIVEENFAMIPAWHPLVDRVIPIALRRWRKKILNKKTLNEWQQFLKNLKAETYDLVIDAQGLLKSALVSRFAKTQKFSGLDWRSAREPMASLFYNPKIPVEKKQHAIIRTRELFAKALSYAVPTDIPDYGIDRGRFIAKDDSPAYLVFLHGTTWATKHWPEEYWLELARLADKAGQEIKLFWGNMEEKLRAERIAAVSTKAHVLPRLELSDIAKVLAGATAVVAVDTGLGHLAAALDVPTVSLYGPTNASLTGALGRSQIHLSTQFACAPCLSRNCELKDYSPLKLANPLYPPCFTDLPPLLVWDSVAVLL